MGTRGAPLICGYEAEHAALEADLADLCGAGSVLLFGSGFLANATTLAALAGPDLTIYSDATNHASIVDGCRMARLAGAQLEIYAHRNTQQLCARLANCTTARRLIVSDSVFSMDGDLAPLRELAELRQRFDTLLMTDEAHATLLYGPRGGGLGEQWGLAGQVDFHIGTLSKAVGALGGFVACAAGWRALLLHRARGFIFSTALPLPVIAAARAALWTAQAPPALRQRLWRHVRRFGAALGRPASAAFTAIELGDEHQALTAAAALGARGLHVVAIRPPTVAPGTSRLRISFSAAHSEDDIERLITALDDLGLLRSAEAARSLSG
jgi:8-amino-7-oxononanoate synthase